MAPIEVLLRRLLMRCFLRFHVRRRTEMPPFSQHALRQESMSHRAGRNACPTKESMSNMRSCRESMSHCSCSRAIQHADGRGKRCMGGPVDEVAGEMEATKMEGYRKGFRDVIVRCPRRVVGYTWHHDGMVTVSLVVSFLTWCGEAAVRV